MEIRITATITVRSSGVEIRHPAPRPGLKAPAREPAMFGLPTRKEMEGLSKQTLVELLGNLRKFVVGCFRQEVEAALAEKEDDS